MYLLLPPYSLTLPLLQVKVNTGSERDAEHILKEFVTSNHPWAVKFREYAKKAYGIDFTGPPLLLNEMIIDWHEEKE
jgi:hypothetical protein